MAKPFGQLILCLLSDVGMSFHPVKCLLAMWTPCLSHFPTFAAKKYVSLAAKTLLGRERKISGCIAGLNLMFEILNSNTLVGESTWNNSVYRKVKQASNSGESE